MGKKLLLSLPHLGKQKVVEYTCSSAKDFFESTKRFLSKLYKNTKFSNVLQETPISVS